MNARAFTHGLNGLPAGLWRWAALGLAALSLAAAALALASGGAAGWTGILLVAGIGAVACLFLLAVWPRETLTAAEARRIAEAAARANVAWAITGADGAVLDCNDVYRRMAGAGETDAAPPPELALGGEASSAMLYRLARSAAEGKPLEESLRIHAGLEVVVAVRPLSGGKDEGHAAWWFAPRLAATSAEAPPAAPPASAAFFRDAPVGVAIADAAGKLSETNACFANFFGPTMIDGRMLADLVEPADRAGIAEFIARIDDAADRAAAIELRPLGQPERMAELYASPVKNGAILYLVDVSEQKALETKFAQSQKMQAVGQLAGGVAHDFNNLLTVIIGNCDLLLMRHHAGDPSFKEINEVRQTALRAASLIGQLLAFSRKQTLQPKPLMLKDTLGELAHMLRRLVGEGIEVKLEQAPDLWLVYADETQISNAIINLVVNARDAMGTGGSVTLRTANEAVATASAFGTAIMPAGDYVRLEVADTGSGIAKEHLGKIFDPFFTTKDVGQGTGLGLATVYGIVKQTGGYIAVDSEKGQGTT
ncbi:MAG: two-component system sensor histidine kinase NtrB, partial [Rhizomicrobium sp.]